jgi:iron uptake system EfeUOB component EfeO/EfeM
MKAFKLIVPAVLAASLALTACGAQQDKKAESQPATSSQTANTTSSSTESAASSPAEGAKAMKQALADMKTNVNADNAAKVKEDADKLEESWQAFEDGVKEKNPDLYEKVEKPLGIIQGGAKAQKLDKAVLSKSIDELDGVLTEVENIK